MGSGPFFGTQADSDYTLPTVGKTRFHAKSSQSQSFVAVFPSSASSPASSSFSAFVRAPVDRSLFVPINLFLIVTLIE